VIEVFLSASAAATAIKFAVSGTSVLLVALCLAAGRGALRSLGLETGR
jgi:hypothetical protein